MSLECLFQITKKILEPSVTMDHLLKPFRFAIFSIQFVDSESFLKEKKKRILELIRKKVNSIIEIIPQVLSDISFSP